MSEWQPIETAPKDGTPFFGWEEPQRGNQWPVVIMWSEYDDEGKDEIGEEGFWLYCEELLADVAGEAEPTHWMPLPNPPIGAGRAD